VSISARENFQLHSMKSYQIPVSLDMSFSTHM